jgi:hypothetical protein
MEMEQSASSPIVREIMTAFADLTGLSSDRAPRRYLWTDAFAVCNFLELYRQTKEEPYKQLALNLVEQVHHILGRHRVDDRRSGWISGLAEGEGARHPTRGGLRIGKGMNERGAGEPYNEELEWDRDGQYYHYLTKWMHALNRVGWVTRDPTYTRWAVELVKAVHGRFTYIPSQGGRRRMYWKMSVDLSRPLVPSMGHHDPLDGLITYLELEASLANIKNSDLDLRMEITEMAEMCKGKDWATSDTLGAGELLSLAYRLAQLIVNHHTEGADLLNDILDSSRAGLQLFEREPTWMSPARYRLAFRELGLLIGLHAVERLMGLIERTPRDFKKSLPRPEGLMRYHHLSKSIETFWLQPANQGAPSWTAHRDINMVMLATSLAPDGYLSAV